MGKCCSKPEKEENREEEEETHEVLLEVDPGGGAEGTETEMTGGTLVVRTPSRWQVTTTRDIPTATTKTTSAKRVVTTDPKNGIGAAAVTKTFRFGTTGSSGGQSVTTYSNGSGRVTTTKNIGSSGGSGVLQQSRITGRVTTPGNNINNRNNAKAAFAIATPRMGKTVTETATRVYTKDGKRFQETVETITKEDDSGNITKTTKTVTKELNSFDTKEMAAAIDTKTKTSKGHSRKSSGSSDSSPDRIGTRTKTKTSEKSSSRTGVFGKSKLRSAAKPSGDDSSDDEEFVEDVFKGVNESRKKHGVKTLKLSKELNEYAKEWARKLAFDDRMSHRPDNKYGENVYCMSSNSKTFKVKGSEVVDKWYSEIKDHVFGQEPKGTLLKSGHFSQMIWKDTKQMGVGKARSAAGTKIFVVANFDPQGNWMGQFATQVPPVGGFLKLATQGKTTPSVTSKSRKSSSSSDTESADEENFAEDCLKAHNDYRKKHGVPPLKLSKNLNKFAKEWAKIIAKKNVLQHRDNNNYGENIYCAWSSNPKHKIKGSEAVDSWYSEIKDYTFGREPADLRAGHFTQVVWQDSKELGIGIARSSSGKIFVVANYNPAGNFVGSFASKVPKPK